ncbi:F-box only protein 21-like [Antedon mediterranea]|uniref:F-box only protein 21-like n=1 Tax=Antedon mediterranea TaxID=105859 RepID=UPI003AF78D71
MQSSFLDDFADELLEYILLDRALEAHDILSFRCTCKRFQRISHSNKVWKAKVLCRWPELGQISNSVAASHDWQELYKFRFHSVRKVYNLLQDVIQNCYEDREVSYKRFTPFQQLGADYSNTIVGNICIEEQLFDLLNNGDEFSNLTQKYYALRALRCLQHPRLEEEFMKLLDAPEDNQTLEESAILISQWNQCGTRVNKLKVYKQLNDIANMVRQNLCTKYGDNHPASQGSEDESLSVDQCILALDVFNEVFYEIYHFEGNKADYYNPDNSFINKVLESKKGIPISLAVVYAAVARRLGISLEPVNFPNHFLLRLDVQPMQENNPKKYKYIDVFHSGKRLTNAECFSLSPMMGRHGNEYFRSCSKRAVYVRMVANLMRITSHLDDVRMLDGYELFLLLCSDDMDAAIMLRRFYLQSGMNISEVLNYLSKCEPTGRNMLNLVKYLMCEAKLLLHEEENKNKNEVMVKRRAENQDVEYSVGMIMRHRRYDYLCVIYGWDSQCDMPDSWKIQMGVDRLPNKDKQPFYNVLVSDQSKRYAAQESLMVEENPEVVSHSEVGKHFTAFKNTHYQANSELLKRYPDDVNVTIEKSNTGCVSEMQTA